MAIHALRRTQIVAAPLGECWAFFSNPRNLALITPPGLDFQVLSELPAAVYPGMMIEYRVRPLLGIPVRWLTEITHVFDRFGTHGPLVPLSRRFHKRSSPSLDPFAHPFKNYSPVLREVQRDYKREMTSQHQRPLRIPIPEVTHAESKS